MMTNSSDNIIKISLISSLFFSLAHLTHLYESLRNGNTFINSLINYLVIFFYTFFFSNLSFLLFYYTKNIYTSILSHIYCNYIGLPDFNSIFSNYGTFSLLFYKNYFIFCIHLLGLVIFFYLLPRIF